VTCHYEYATKKSVRIYFNNKSVFHGDIMQERGNVPELEGAPHWRESLLPLLLFGR
jgi:hypothetical protein